jgi:hypothetical protein
MRNTSHSSQRKILTNSLCHDVGHDWKSSLGTTYRLCQRKDCRLAQRLVDGTWREIATRRRSRQSQSEQRLLWDELTLLAQGLHPRQHEIERQAEQHSYHLFKI